MIPILLCFSLIGQSDFPCPGLLRRVIEGRMRCRGAIIGAGIIGSAVAFELSRRGEKDLHVFDPSLEGPLSSTERNAGGVRHLWQHRINFELSSISIQLFEKIRAEIGFQQSGYLWLFSKENTSHGKEVLSKASTFGRGYEELSVAEMKRRYTFIDKTDDLAFGVFGPKDGIINSNALKNYYRSEAKKKEVTFHDRKALLRLKSERNLIRLEVKTLRDDEESHDFLSKPGDWNTETSDQYVQCDYVVLCSGPWMHSLLASLGVPAIVTPIRRQIAFFRAENFDMTPYGMIVDSSHVYFHPEGGNILAGLVLKDEKSGYNFNYDSGFFDEHIWPALHERSSHFEKLKHLNGWSGLYSYTPDTTGILGRVPGMEHVFEAHSFTGRGIMQSYGAAAALADLILISRFEGIDASGLDRTRFDGPQSRWLHEKLHI